MNRYQFIGNLGQDAEIRRPENTPGKCVINFSVAVSEKWTDAKGQQQERTTWVRCSMWRKEESLKIANYLLKGQKVYIEGKPTARAYVAKDGSEAASLEVTVDNLELLGSVQPAQGGATPQQARNQAVTFGGAPLEQGPPPATRNQFAPQDDDLPF